MSETFKKSQMSEFFDVSSGWQGENDGPLKWTSQLTGLEYRGIAYHDIQ